MTKVVELSRREAADAATLIKLIPDDGSRLVLLDIGGWFAPAIEALSKQLGHRFVGVIEDTENGHQKYEALGTHSVPIISVARSPLKDNEDFLVGQSVVFSADAILRECGRILQYLNCGVIGYGKIGNSIAHHLLLRGIKPQVCEKRPIRAIEARNRLCHVVSEDALLATCDIVFCATGNQALALEQFRSLRRGAFVFSVTSVDGELDLSFLKDQFQREAYASNVDVYRGHSNYFYLVNGGNAVNFLHKAVLGEYICLVRAEMLLAVKRLLTGGKVPGISELLPSDRDHIASMWISAMSSLERAD